jgi:hypothetical protein
MERMPPVETSGARVPVVREAPVRAASAPGLLRAAWRDLVVAGIVLVWVPLVLLLDRGASLGFQRGLGAGTWLLLLALLRRETPLVRAQVAVVVVFATVVEYTFSPLLEVYVYRLDNVPAFVPPGHGLVYLCALALGRTPLFAAYARPLVVATVVGLGAYAGWGLLLAPQLDVLGAFWFVCLVGFLRWGRSPGLYVGAAIVVTYLELLGTWLGTWTWQTVDPTGIVAIGNPPSGAAGGYGWFDLAAVLGAPRLLRLWEERRRIGAGRPGGEPAEHGGVQMPVGRDRAARLGAPDAVEVGEPSAGLLDDDGEGRQVVQREVGFGRRVDRALGDEHVGPEVAVRAAAPARREQVDHLIEPPDVAPRRQAGVRERRVGQRGDVGDAAAACRGEAAAGPGARAARRPPPPAERRR